MSEKLSKFAPVLDALQDYDHPFPPRLLRDFSDLPPNHLHDLRLIWPEIKSERKIALLEDLENVAESDSLVSFDEFAKLALKDEDPAVRVLSIRLLWECEETRLVSIFTEMMLSDDSPDVRAAAASALGKFVLLGELETIPETIRVANVQNLIDVVKGEDLPMVRRRALESLGYSSHPKVPELIETALSQSDIQWLTSALYAIGRSADERWAERVISHLDSTDGEVIFEAVHAAGELELEDARDILMEKLDETLEDQELRYAIIWSLSQIGGESVKKKLEELLEKSPDDDEVEWIEKALDNLELGGQMNGLELMEFDSPENLDEDGEEDDEEEDELDDDFLGIDEDEYEN
jgi:HEAT repeat protein